MHNYVSMSVSVSISLPVPIRYWMDLLNRVISGLKLSITSKDWRIDSDNDHSSSSETRCIKRSHTHNE